MHDPGRRLTNLLIFLYSLSPNDFVPFFILFCFTLVRCSPFLDTCEIHTVSISIYSTDLVKRGYTKESKSFESFAGKTNGKNGIENVQRDISAWNHVFCASFIDTTKQWLDETHYVPCCCLMSGKNDWTI